MEPYTPNPNNKHSTISLLTDDDRERSLSYDPPLQELADNNAYLEARTLGRIGAVSDMQAATGVTVGDCFIVITNGVYYYNPLLDFGYGGPPWTYDATGMGHGVWVHSMWQSLFGSSTPAKILTALLPVIPASLRPEFHTYILGADSWRVANFVSPRQNLTGSVWTALNNGVVDLSASIIGVQAGDKVRISIGPLKAYVTSTESGKHLSVRATVTDGVSPQVVRYYPINSALNDVHSLAWSFEHRVSYGPLTVQLFGYADAAYVMHPDYSGASDFEWGHYTILRDPE